jgi:hypothetical protein
VPKVVLRFYGRFTYAVGFENNQETGTIQVLAPVFDTARFGDHHPVMTIRRDQVDLREGKTTAQPFRRWVNDNAKILESEYLSWDLSGLGVTFPTVNPNGKASLKRNPAQDGLIFNLPDLEKAKGRDVKLDPSALKANSSGKTKAVISVVEGEGIPHQVSATDDVFLLQHDDAADGDATDPTVVKSNGTAVEFPLADLVEFTINLPRGVTKLTFLLTNPRTGEATSVVASTTSANNIHDPQPEDRVTVAFSHHCAELPPFRRPYDFEFFQYYNLLEARLDDSLVPKTVVPGGEAGDCDAKARVDYDVQTFEGRLTPK